MDFTGGVSDAFVWPLFESTACVNALGFLKREKWSRNMERFIGGVIFGAFIGYLAD